MREQQAVLRQVQAELGASDLQGVSRLWGGDRRDPAPPPRVVDMETFALEARQRSAVRVVQMMNDRVHREFVGFALVLGIEYPQLLPFTATTPQVVFIAAMDEVALTGALAMGFEELGVRFTGAGWTAAQMCNDSVRADGGTVCCGMPQYMWNAITGGYSVPTGRSRVDGHQRCATALRT